jgi:uncharacterized protein (TIGR01777 family)
MKIVAAGGSGFIGSALVKRLVSRGDEVAVLSRNPAKVRVGRGVPWNPPSAGPWTAEIAAADAVINLAGENVGEGRWTAERKSRILQSRLHATGALAQALHDAPRRQRTFISASAVGYYGPRSDETLDESGSTGSGFLAEVTRRWEAAAHGADDVARVVILRFGVVLGAGGGALQKMLLPFRLGVGGPIGSGRQWMSWVDREDVLRIIEWALDHAGVKGTYNATSPHPLPNREFALNLGRVLHRPSVLPTPGFALRLLFGDMADEMLLSGQRVVPARATAEGFAFTYPMLDDSLRHALA